MPIMMTTSSINARAAMTIIIASGRNKESGATQTYHNALFYNTSDMEPFQYF